MGERERGRDKRQADREKERQKKNSVFHHAVLSQTYKVESYWF